MSQVVIDNWWSLLLKEHETDGIKDADAGIFEPPYPNSDDPQEQDQNLAYKKGFDKRRKELGKNFRWT